VEHHLCKLGLRSRATVGAWSVQTRLSQPPRHEWLFQSYLSIVLLAWIASVVVTLNLILRGWKAYFRNGTSSRKFTIVDHYVHERLAGGYPEDKGERVECLTAGSP